VGRKPIGPLPTIASALHSTMVAISNSLTKYLRKQKREGRITGGIKELAFDSECLYRKGKNKSKDFLGPNLFP
jgi:hypothetical protein